MGAALCDRLNPSSKGQAAGKSEFDGQRWNPEMHVKLSARNTGVPSSRFPLHLASDLLAIKEATVTLPGFRRAPNRILGRSACS